MNLQKGLRRLAIVVAAAYWLVVLLMIGSLVHSTYWSERQALQSFEIDIMDTQTLSVVAKSDAEVEEIMRRLCGPPRLEELRSRYPEYDDLATNDLADAVYRRFYQTMPRDQFDREFAAPTGRCDGTDPQGKTLGDEHSQALSTAMGVGFRQLGWAAAVFATISGILFAAIWVWKGFRAKGASRLKPKS